MPVAYVGCSFYLQGLSNRPDWEDAIEAAAKRLSDELHTLILGWSNYGDQ